MTMPLKTGNPMRESTTYQAILREGREEGREEEARKFLRRQGAKRFGAPTPTVLATLDQIEDLDRLETLGDRIVDPEVTSWDQLLENL